MVKIKAVWAHHFIRAASYLYLVLPVMIFFLGWCRWYVGIPSACILAVSFVQCLKEHHKETGKEVVFLYTDCVRLAVIVMAVLVWVGLSGVGGYAWQNADHPIRNEMFVLLVEEKWPLVKELAGAAGSEARGMVYYLGYWLPAAVTGKLFGLAAGWAMQYLWAAAGILLMYAWICIWRKRIAVWPLWIFMFFSGLDSVGMLLGSREGLQVFGDLHLEAWAPYYQYSSMTTQLFWVFNQAVPAWLLAALVFAAEKPRNMAFLASLTILTSTFPFAGILPYVLYFMVVRSRWGKDCTNIRTLLKNCWRNWGSLQNVAGSAVTLFICGIYISGNNAVRNSLPWLNSGSRAALLAAGAVLTGVVLWLAAVFVMRGRGRLVFGTALITGIIVIAVRFGRLPYADWQSPLFYWMNLTLFYMAEAGVYLVALYPAVEDRRLFTLNAVWLYVIPLILVGKSCDFCMRASIPGLFLIMFWCIHAVDIWTSKNGVCRMRVFLLSLLLLAGAVTPLHEVKRSFVNTRDYYENRIAGEDEVLMGNNFSGSTEGFFWRHLAKVY